MWKWNPGSRWWSVSRWWCSGFLSRPPACCVSLKLLLTLTQHSQHDPHHHYSRACPHLWLSTQQRERESKCVCCFCSHCESNESFIQCRVLQYDHSVKHWALFTSWICVYCKQHSVSSYRNLSTGDKELNLYIHFNSGTLTPLASSPQCCWTVQGVEINCQTALFIRLMRATVELSVAVSVKSLRAQRRWSEAGLLRRNKFSCLFNML